MKYEDAAERALFFHYKPCRYMTSMADRPKDFMIDLAGCVLDIDNPRAEKCYMQVDKDPGRPITNKASIGFPAGWGATWHIENEMPMFVKPKYSEVTKDEQKKYIEMDFPVCKKDEKNEQQALEDMGCYIDMSHHHKGVQHLHAVCPVHKVGKVVGHIKDYVKRS